MEQQTADRHLNGLRWIFFLFYMGVGIFHPYLYVHLRNTGLSESVVGWISFLHPVCLLVIQPLWGTFGDYLGRPDRVLQIAGFGAGSVAVLFLFDAPAWVYFLTVPLFFGFGSAVDPIANAATVATDRASGQHGEYGYKRLWGSIGFVLGAVVSGGVSEWYGIPAIFPVYSIVMIGMLCRTHLVSDVELEPSTLPAIGKGLKRAISVPKYRWLLVFLVLWGIPFSGNFVAFGWYWKDLGGADYGIGLAWILAAVLEVPFYLLSVRFKELISYRGLLIFSSAVAALRWLLYVLFPDPALLYLFQPLHALMFVSFSVGGVYLIDHLSDDIIKNTGQGLLSASIFGAGAAIGNLLAGLVYDSYGPVYFYSLMIAINLLAIVIGVFKLEVEEAV